MYIYTYGGGLNAEIGTGADREGGGGNTDMFSDANTATFRAAQCSARPSDDSPESSDAALGLAQRDFFIDNLLVRIHFIIDMIWWTGLAPWEFEFPFPGSLTSTFLDSTHTSTTVELTGQALCG